MNALFKALKWLVILLVLALVALAGALFLVDPNDLKPKIVAAVHDATGRDLALTGDLSWSFYPSLGVNVGQAQLSNAKGFSSPYFAKVDGLSVQVKLLPLFKKSIEIRGVSLNDLSLDLEVNKNGVSNWADLAGEAQPDKAEQTQVDESESFDVSQIKLQGIHIKNANIHFKDAQSKLEYSVSRFNTDIGELNWADPMPVKGDFLFEDKIQGLSVDVAYDSDLLLNLKDEVYRLSNTQLDVKANGKSLPVQPLDVSLGVDALVDLKKQNIKLSDLALKLDQSRLSGEVLVNGFAKSDVKFDLNLDSIDIDRYIAKQTSNTAPSSSKSATGDDVIALPVEALRALMLDGKLSVGSIKTGDIHIQNLSLNAKAEGGKISISPINWTMFDAPFNAQAGLNVVGASPVYSLSAQLQKLQLKPLLSRFAQYEDLQGIASANVSVRSSGARVSQLVKNISGDLKSLAVNGTLNSKDFPNPIQLDMSAQANVRGENINLNQLVFKFDETTVKGQSTVAGLANPIIRFNVDVDKLNIDQYLKGSQESAKKSKNPDPTSGDEDLGLPVELLRALDMNGKVTVGALQVMNAKAANVRAQMNAKSGLIQLNPLSMDLYKGTFTGYATVDARGDTPTYKLDTKLDKLQVNPMMVDVASLDYVSGLGDVNLNISTQGNTVNQIKKGLNGGWNVSLDKGVLKSNLLQGTGKLLALMDHANSAQSLEKVTTPFKKLVGSGSIHQGVIKSNQFKFDADGINFDGVGSLDIVQGVLDVGLNLKKDNFACTLPIKGSISGLNYEKIVQRAIPGCLESAAKQKVQMKLDDEKAKAEAKLQEKLDKEKAKLKEQLDKKLDKQTQELEKQLQDKLEDKAKDELKGALKGLFK